MFTGRIVTIMGRRWAVTVPGYDGLPKRFISLPHGFSFRSPSVEIITAKSDSGCAYCHYRYSSGGSLSAIEHGSSHWAPELLFLPIFVPVDENREYDASGLAGLPDGPFEFCVPVFRSRTGEFRPISVQAKYPRFNCVNTTAKFVPEDIAFGDIGDRRSCYRLSVRKHQGCLVACDAVACCISADDLFCLGYLQRDLPVHRPYVTWIDGEPWEVRVPRAFGTDSAVLQHLYSNRCLLNKLMEWTKGSHCVAPLSVTGASSHLREVVVSYTSSMVVASVFDRLMFCPDLVPLNPKTLEADDAALRDIPDNTMVSLGGFLVDGSLSFGRASDDHVAKYSPGQVFQFCDSPADSAQRMQFVKLGDRLMSVSPILKELSLMDAIKNGWVDDYSLFTRSTRT